jgi:6-phosphogluconolactonase (cycloisomerase 2 family)
MMKIIFTAAALLLAGAAYAADEGALKALPENVIGGDGELRGYLSKVETLPNGDVVLTAAYMLTGVLKIKENDKCFEVTTKGFLKDKEQGGENVQEPVTTESRVIIPCPTDSAV